MQERYVPLEKLLLAADSSLYKLTMLVAKRAFQLAEGAKPRVNTRTDKVLPIAIEEVSAGDIVLENIPEDKSKKAAK